MIIRDKGTGEFAISCILAVFVAGLLYIGVLLLNEAPPPKGMKVVEGAIRLAQPQRDKSQPELRRRKLDEAKPPKELPKTHAHHVAGQARQAGHDHELPQFFGGSEPQRPGRDRPPLPATSATWASPWTRWTTCPR